MRKRFFFKFVFTFLLITTLFYTNRNLTKVYAKPNITFPDHIYKNEAFTIDFDGLVDLVNNGCYKIIINPPVPKMTASIGYPSCGTPASDEYIRARLPKSGKLVISGPNEIGEHTFYISGFNSRENDFLSTKFSVEEKPVSNPAVDLKVCVYPKGTPTTGACSNTGKKEDIFIATGNIKNISSPTPVNLYYSTGSDSYLLLSSTNFDANGNYMKDISADLQKINITSFSGGEIKIYSSIVSTTEYKSPIVNIVINDLTIITPTTNPFIDPRCKEILIPSISRCKTQKIASVTPCPPRSGKESALCPDYNQSFCMNGDPAVGNVVCEVIPPFPPPCLTDDMGADGKCEKITTGLGVVIPVDPAGFVKSLFGILLSLSGGIALVLIIFSGYQLMTSQGNPEKVQAAKETLTSAIVGLLFIIFSMVILQIIGVKILKMPWFK